VAKCRLLINGVVYCLALSICCDGHVEGLRPRHVVVLYTIGEGLSQHKENSVSFVIGDGEICNAVRLPVRKMFENSVPSA